MMENELPDIPEMSHEEVRLHAEHMMQAENLDGCDYQQIVRILTVAQYISDLCIKELEDRGQLTESENGLVMIPDGRPESLFVETVLTR